MDKFEFPSALTIVTITISVFALIIAFLNFRRKSYLSIRASYILARSKYSEDPYVSSIFIENMKDRSISIFGIYLRLRNNCYVEIEIFEAHPIILKAFETWSKEYGEIEFYESNAQRILINSLSENSRVSKNIVLSTSEGRYVVKKQPKHWSPTNEFFKNYQTVVIRPIF